MKILIIMGGFFPGQNYGGPPVSVDNFCNLMTDYECYIVALNHDMGEKKAYESISDGWNKYGRANVMYLSDKDFCYSTFISIAAQINPDVLYLQGLFQRCVIPCLLMAKQKKIKVILAPRGELCTGAFRKKWKKIPYIYFLRIGGLLKDVHFQSTSDDEFEGIEKRLNVERNRIHQLPNVPTIASSSDSYRNKNKGEGKFVFISRISPKKNLQYAISQLSELKGSVTYDIYGPKEDGNYWKKCEEEISKLPPNIKVNYMGVIHHDQISCVYNKYDAFFLPTVSENYGHVIAEAIIGRCLPIISDQTPWTDINNYNAGWAIPLEEKNQFKNALQTVIDMDNNLYHEYQKRLEEYCDSKIQLEKIRIRYKQAFDIVCSK